LSSNVVYYPYITPPNNEWFIRILLYWDKIFSIVPSEYLDKSHEFDDWMKDLLETNLVQPIIPKQYIDRVPNFENAFLQYIDSRSHISSSRSQRTIPIHIEKLKNIGDRLKERNLATNREYPWWNVEYQTGNEFMAYLATVLGELSQFKAIPMTNSLDSFSFVLPKSNHILDKIRQGLLEDVLPAPKNCIDPRVLVGFKDDNKETLRRFRTRIEEVSIELATIEDDYLRQRKKEIFLEEIKQDKRDIISLLEGNNWNVSNGKIIGYAIVKVAAAGISGIFAAATSALEIASLIKRKRSTRNQIEFEQNQALQNHFSTYAVFADQEFELQQVGPYLYY